MLHLNFPRPARALLAIATATVVTFAATAQLSPLQFGGHVTALDDPSAVFGDNAFVGEAFTASYSFAGALNSSVVDSPSAYWRTVTPSFGPGSSSSFTVGTQLFESPSWTAQIYDSHELSGSDALRIYADDFTTSHDFGLMWAVELVGPHDLFPAAAGDWTRLISLPGYPSMTAQVTVYPKNWFTPELWFLDSSQPIARVDVSIDSRQAGPAFVPVPEPSTYGAIGALLLTATVLLRRRPSGLRVS